MILTLLPMVKVRPPRSLTFDFLPVVFSNCRNNLTHQGFFCCNSLHNVHFKLVGRNLISALDDQKFHRKDFNTIDGKS